MNCKECNKPELENGICLDCGTSTDVTDLLDGLHQETAELDTLVRWARTGVNERSCNMMLDYYAVLIGARRVDRMRKALRVLIDHAKETYPHFESERGQNDIKEAEETLL